MSGINAIRTEDGTLIALRDLREGDLVIFEERTIVMPITKESGVYEKTITPSETGMFKVTP